MWPLNAKSCNAELSSSRLLNDLRRLGGGNPSSRPMLPCFVVVAGLSTSLYLLSWPGNTYLTRVLSSMDAVATKPIYSLKMNKIIVKMQPSVAMLLVQNPHSSGRGAVTTVLSYCRSAQSRAQKCAILKICYCASNETDTGTITGSDA